MISTEVRRYRLSPAGLTVERKRLWTRSFLPLVVICWSALAAFTAYLVAKGAHPAPLVITWVVFVIYFVALGFRVQRKLTAGWESYELEIGPDYVLRRQRGLSDLRLGFQEIKAIERIPGRYLKVLGTEWLHSIEISEFLENFPEVVQTLSRIKAPECRRVAQSYKLMIVGALSLGGFGFMLTVTSPVLIISFSLSLYALFMWAFLAIRRNPNWDRGARMMAWAYLGFAVICIVKFGQALRDLFSH